MVDIPNLHPNDIDDVHVHWRVLRADNVNCFVDSTTTGTQCLWLYNVETTNLIYGLDDGNNNIEIGLGQTKRFRDDTVEDFVLRYELVWNLTPAN